MSSPRITRRLAAARPTKPFFKLRARNELHPSRPDPLQLWRDVPAEVRRRRRALQPPRQPSAKRGIGSPHPLLTRQPYSASHSISRATGQFHGPSRRASLRSQDAQRTASLSGRDGTARPLHSLRICETADERGTRRVHGSARRSHRWVTHAHSPSRLIIVDVLESSGSAECSQPAARPRSVAACPSAARTRGRDRRPQGVQELSLCASSTIRRAAGAFTYTGIAKRSDSHKTVAVRVALKGMFATPTRAIVALTISYGACGTQHATINKD